MIKTHQISCFMESFFFDNGQAFAGFQISLKKKNRRNGYTTRCTEWKWLVCYLFKKQIELPSLPKTAVKTAYHIPSELVQTEVLNYFDFVHTVGQNFFVLVFFWTVTDAADCFRGVKTVSPFSKKSFLLWRDIWKFSKATSNSKISPFCYQLKGFSSIKFDS